jgi:hypothetical protein
VTRRRTGCSTFAQLKKGVSTIEAAALEAKRGEALRHVKG